MLQQYLLYCVSFKLKKLKFKNIKFDCIPRLPTQQTALSRCIPRSSVSGNNVSGSYQNMSNTFTSSCCKGK